MIENASKHKNNGSVVEKKLKKKVYKKPVGKIAKKPAAK